MNNIFHAYEMIADQLNETFYTFLEKKPSIITPDPSWKRKKCKSCRSYGSYYCGNCNKYIKPNHNACKNYKQK